MRRHLILAIFCLPLLAGAKPLTVPAWQNCVDAAAASAALDCYTSNVVRCSWAGEDAKVSRFMPANLAFQFAVIGDSNSASRVQKTLVEVADALDPEIRKTLEKFGVLNSTLQWLVRSCRPGVTNWTEYFKTQNNPAAFMESDFDADKLKLHASRFKSIHQIPLPASVSLQYAEQSTPLGKAEPGVDYPDILPEETFVFPLGSAVVVRAPERRRKIRLRASVWPFGVAREYVWRTSSWLRIYPWDPDKGQTVARGFADIVFETHACNPRLDVFVWPKFNDKLYGPPAIVSIYNVPYAKRNYGKTDVKSITYVKTSPLALYDLSPIWVPREWKDVFERNDSGQTITVARTLPGRIRPDVFSATGELVRSLSPSGYPLSTCRVEYYVDPDTGMLTYREVGDEITYRLGTCPFRRSGE